MNIYESVNDEHRVYESVDNELRVSEAVDYRLINVQLWLVATDLLNVINCTGKKKGQTNALEGS